MKSLTAQHIISASHSPFTDTEKRAIEDAFVFSEKAHTNQKRESGEPYFTHLVETARHLARIGADATTITAGLLHDSVEDVEHITIQEIRDRFGDEVAFLVDGVTKLGKLKYRGLKRHVETLRKLFLATARDPRVILIKLADRLHNLETISSLPREKQQRIAMETLEIYAPIAHRLGIGNLKGELEDVAFKTAYPKEYEHTRALREEKSKENLGQLKKLAHELRTILIHAHIPVLVMDYRVKHIYSLHKKLQEKDMNIDRVYDIEALRIIVTTIEECYLALGLIHSKWKPLPGRIKDYIAMPKRNGYQSLHTTVFTGNGAIVEIQIRTKEMHDIAEYGIASHVGYKEKAPGQKQESSASWVEKLFGRNNPEQSGVSPMTQWIHELTETQHTVEHSLSFIKNLRTDFFNDRIFVFTPNGEVVDLPVDATPIDFAYSIHTDLGDHASGARVNGKFVALSTKLNHGDVVFVETKDNSKPSHKWLTWAKTGFAKKNIRAALEKKD
ncbi:bifunctional (p)ppGpp synthetase/guanosine-3',5'-bis(diphosphate) 3'-pyrophosphohydrolase [Candidatus Campbellbacteria bacterium]|nr:MAG: bifunctional (p)ppGpp synthetase/guanosine-3',5'-bis(diphosphate) 3'-pyrophosphohydrolase [Candidatus Campbellbacteria bacterium]